jgi:cyanophycin synthetase
MSQVTISGLPFSAAALRGQQSEFHEENSRREKLVEAQFDLKSIVVDSELVRVLSKQGFSLNDRLPENTSVLLRSVANISTGGTLEDCTSIIHPDTVMMAESVARSFRLDTVGIDFITPDIGKSWQDCECAIIEINGVPGFSNDEHAGLILERKFAGKSNGRIPIVLILDCKQPIHDIVVSELGSIGPGVGYVNEDNCKLDNHARGQSLEQISDKVNALLYDPACNSLVVELSTNEIETRGLPVDRCSVFLLSRDNNVPDGIMNIIEAASGSVFEISDIDEFKPEHFRRYLSY